MSYPLVAGCIAKSCTSLLFGENKKRDIFVYVTRVENNQVHIVYPVFDMSLKKGASFVSTTACTPKYLTPISPSITNPEEMSNFLGTCGMKLSDVVKTLELADPTTVYPMEDRIDFNGLNEGTVKYDLETLEKVAIKSNMALEYYQQIFAEFLRRENNAVEDTKKPAKAVQEKNQSIRAKNAFDVIYDERLPQETKSSFSTIDIELEMQRIATLRKIADMQLEVNDIKSEMIAPEEEPIPLSDDQQYFWSTAGSGSTITGSTITLTNGSTTTGTPPF